MKTLVLLITFLGCQASAFAISADFMDSSFESIIDIPNVTQIEAWEQPRTQYTPKNLRSEYQIRYNGTDNVGLTFGLGGKRK